MGEDNARVMEAPSNRGHAGHGFEMAPKEGHRRVEPTTRVVRQTVFDDMIGDGDIDDPPRYPSGTSSAFGAVANFLNSIVGAGIVGMPFALAQSGLWAGMLMICLAGFLTHNSTMMLVSAGEKANRLNYEELMAQVFGAVGFHSFNFFAGVLAFGAMSAYLIIVADTVTEIASAAGSTGLFTDRVSVILLLGTLVVLPVASLKDLAKLSYTSFVSVIAEVLLVIIVVWNGPDEAEDVEGIDESQRLEFIRPKIFAGFGAISFAFVCQSSSFLVYRSMATKSVGRWRCVSRWAVSAALVLGLSLAFAGYGSFVNKTEGNILNNFSTEHKAANVARGFLAVTMVLTYPIEMYVTRHVLDASIFQTLLGLGPITSTRHYGITMLLWLLSVVLAVSTNDLGNIMEIFGAFGASTIGYIMPAMLFIQTNRGQLRTVRAAWRRDSPEYVDNLYGRLRAMHKFYLPFFMVAFGFVALIAGVATAITDELHPTKT